jgi:hypothetical protein
MSDLDARVLPHALGSGVNEGWRRWLVAVAIAYLAFTGYILGRFANSAFPTVSRSPRRHRPGPDPSAELAPGAQMPRITA